MGRLRDRPGSAPVARPEPLPADRSATGARSALARTWSWLRLHSLEPRMVRCDRCGQDVSLGHRSRVDLADYSACDGIELRRLLEAREIMVGEVRDAALRAIEAVEPRLNAVVSGPYEDAVAAADGPLAGVPLAVKDTLAEAGRPLAFGSRLLEGYVPRRNGTLAERFRDAGLL